MTSRRSIADRAAAFILAAAWLPFLIVQCPSCPGADTSLVRCALLMKAAALDQGGKASRDAVKPRCHEASHGSAGDEDSPGDCCTLNNRRGTTAKISVDLPVMVPTLVDWAATAPTGEKLASSLRVAHVDRLSHSPPRFLVLRSLLI